MVPSSGFSIGEAGGAEEGQSWSHFQHRSLSRSRIKASEGRNLNLLPAAHFRHLSEICLGQKREGIFCAPCWEGSRVSTSRVRCRRQKRNPLPSANPWVTLEPRTFSTAFPERPTLPAGNPTGPSPGAILRSQVSD